MNLKRHERQKCHPIAIVFGLDGQKRRHDVGIRLEVVRKTAIEGRDHGQQLKAQRLDVPERPQRLEVVVLEVVAFGFRAGGGRILALFFAVFDFLPLSGDGSTQGQDLIPVGLVGVELEEAGAMSATRRHTKMPGVVGE